MQTRLIRTLGFLCLPGFLQLSAQSPIHESSRLELKPVSGTLEFHVTPPPGGYSGAVDLRLQTSTDLIRWELTGPRIRIPKGSKEPASLHQPEMSGHSFFKLIQRPGTGWLASEPDDAIGFQDSYLDHLEIHRTMTVDAFRSRYAPPAYLPAVTFEITNAAFWADFNLKSELKLVANGPGFPIYINTGAYKLLGDEFDFIRTNGFVVLPRLASQSFAEQYLGIFWRDLPVFITVDSMLHPWHVNYDAALRRLEETRFFRAWTEILAAMQLQILNGSLASTLSPTHRQALADAEYVVAVARGLLLGIRPESVLGQDDRLIRAAAAVTLERAVPDYVHFEVPAFMDFSLFTPRGHYTRSPELQRYFKAMSWLGLVYLDIENPREFACAVVLADLLKASGRLPDWSTYDDQLNRLAGISDNLTPAQLLELVRAAGLTREQLVDRPDTLADFQTQLKNGALGLPQLTAPVPVAGAPMDQRKLSKRFALAGQRFSIDAWTLGKVVMRNPAGLDGLPGIFRRRPLGLDAVFAAFGNNAPVPDLADYMQREPTDATKFRLGWKYQPALAAARETIDSLPPETWTSSLYTRWLAVLRSLSQPTTGPDFPQAMRTRAWAMKNLTTQLASWTQLRHDNILITQQSHTIEGTCFYPAGFVEPRPEVFAQLADMADLLKTFQIADTNLADTLTNYSRACRTLSTIAARQFRQEPHTDEEALFIRRIMQRHDTFDGYRPAATYDGWYPGVFYGPKERTFQGNLGGGPGLLDTPACDEPDYIVADVHTDRPAPELGDAGAILYEAIGKVDLMMIVIDNGPDLMTYVGPVLSYHEFEKPFDAPRLNDEQWKAFINGGGKQARSLWTRRYMPSE